MNDKCFESKFNCQKQITFTPRQQQLEGPGFKNIFQKKSERTLCTWIRLLKPAVNVAAQFI